MYEYRAKVLKVVDADTLDIQVDLGFKIFSEMRVRLARIDAWEVRGDEREKGLAAKEYVLERLAAMDDDYLVIKTDKDKTGKYGRYIAEILVPEKTGELTNLNDELVKLGHAEYWEY